MSDALHCVVRSSEVVPSPSGEGFNVLLHTVGGAVEFGFDLKAAQQLRDQTQMALTIAANLRAARHSQLSTLNPQPV